MDQAHPLTQPAKCDRYAVRVVWGVSIQGKVTCHEDPYEKFRVMLRDGNLARL